VPLLKFYYYNLEVDVSCNNEMGTRNTHLLYCYGQVWSYSKFGLIKKRLTSLHIHNPV
jgi:poly(A) RNA polymerase GLD2